VSGACIDGCLRVGVSGLGEGLAPFGAWASAEARASPSGAHAGGAHSCHVFKQIAIAFQRTSRSDVIL